MSACQKELEFWKFGDPAEKGVAVSCFTTKLSITIPADLVLALIPGGSAALNANLLTRLARG